MHWLRNMVVLATLGTCVAALPHINATAGGQTSHEASAASVRFREQWHLLLPFDQLEAVAESPGNGWTAPGGTSPFPAFPFVSGFQPLSRGVFDFLC